MSVCLWHSEGCETHMHLEQEMLESASSPCFLAVGGSLGQELQAQAADGAGGLGGLRPGALPASFPPRHLSVVLPGPPVVGHLGFSGGFCMLLLCRNPF